MILAAKNLSAFPEILHGFTTRELGSDYDRIGREIGVPANSFRTLNQIHSDNVIVIPKSPLPPFSKGGLNWAPPFEKGGWGGILSDGDALITTQPGLFVGIRTADCVPLLLYDPIKKVAAAVHAGWKGILVGIIENSIGKMKREFSSKPSTLIVAVGPTLCPGCFEIGDDVAAEFRNKFGDRLTISAGEKDHYFLDLRKAVELILMDQVISMANVEFYPQCNKCRKDLFFSFRRGDEKPRMLSFIGLKDIT